MKLKFQDLPEELVLPVSDVLSLLSHEEASDGISVSICSPQ